MLWIYLLILAVFWNQSAVEAVPTGNIRRQASPINNIPESCVGVCSVFSTIQSTSSDPLRFCTPSISSGLQLCSDCLILIGGNQVTSKADVLSTTQSAVDGLVSACKDASKSIPSIRISSPTSTFNLVTATGISTGTSNTSHGDKLRSSAQNSLLALAGVLFFTFGFTLSP